MSFPLCLRSLFVTALILAAPALPVVGQPTPLPDSLRAGSLDVSLPQQFSGTQLKEMSLTRQPSGTLLLPNVRPDSIFRVRPGLALDPSLDVDAASRSVAPGEVVMVSTGSTFQKTPNFSPAEHLDTPIYRAPARWVSNAASSTQGTLLMRSLESGFVISRQPSLFKTTLQIWLKSTDGTRPIPLAYPVQIIVSAEDAVSVAPSSIEMTHFNKVNVVEIQADPRHDSLAVSVGLPSQSSPPRAYLDVRRPVLNVSASPTRIDGFGLGESTVRVRVPGRYPSPVTLSAATESASARPSSQTVAPGAVGTFTIRSSGLGTETVRIEGGPFAQAGRTLSLTFVWPLYFLVFAITGSLVGGGIRYYRRLSTDASASLPRILTSGLLIGLVGAVFYGIGISLFPILPAGISGQSVVFLASAAAAVTGPHLPFEKLT